MRMSPLAALAIMAFAAAACGPPAPAPKPPLEPPQPELPESNPVPVPTAPPEPTPPATAAKLTMRWQVPTRGWNKAVAVLPSGDVLSVGGNKIRVHARHDGAVLEERASCAVPFGAPLAVISNTKSLLACDVDVREVSLPGLSSTRLVAFPSPVDVATVGPNRIAGGDRKGHVVVIDVAQRRVVDEFDVAGRVESLAISADDSVLAVGTEHGRIDLRDLNARRSSVLTQDGNTRVGTLAFSPDGKELFADLKIFEASAIDLTSGKAIRSYRIGSWLTTIRYLSDRRVIASGSNGLTLYPADGSAPVAVDDDSTRTPFEGLGTSEDGTTICSGDRSGRVVCFGTSAVQPSTYQPAAQVAAIPPQELLGKIESKTGTTVRISLQEGTVAEGSSGVLYRKFALMLMAGEGWLGVADVQVKKVNGKRVELEISSERSQISVNGRPVNHFQPGLEIKLVVGEN